MWKALIKSALLLSIVIGFPLTLLAECVIAKNSAGQYTHICDAYKADSYELPKQVGDVLLGPQQSLSSPLRYDDDIYMENFTDDTVRENMDFGAVDNPGIAPSLGTASGDDF